MLSRDYLAGLKDVLGEKYDSVVTGATYEVQDPTIDSQIVKLKASGADLSPENILRQAYGIKDLGFPMLLPGIKVKTSPTDHMPVEQMQFMRFNGKTWDRFGELQTGN